MSERCKTFPLVGLASCMSTTYFPKHLSNKNDRNRKGEGHSRNGVFFEIANKKITLSRVTDRGFSF